MNDPALLISNVTSPVDAAAAVMVCGSVRSNAAVGSGDERVSRTSVIAGQPASVLRTAREVRDPWSASFDQSTARTT